MDRTTIEGILGDPALLIVTPENEPLLRDWALAAGYPAVQVHSMTPVALANLYHARQGDTDAAHRAVIATMQALGGSLSPDAVKALIREEIAAHAAAMVRRIEVTTPTAVNIDYDVELERLFANGQHRWLEHVWDVRKTVQDKRIRHVVSSRAIIFGARALNDGEEWSECCDVYLYKGMSEKDRSKIDAN